MKDIVLAGGCFWGVEAYFKRIPGVVETQVGYANGTLENPSYQDVCTSTTGHAEVIYITYDEKQLSLEHLLEEYWGIIDPTLQDQQGPDIGPQYRTGIFYTHEEDLSTILQSKEKEQTKYQKPIVTEVEPLDVFYTAEEYHQDYLDKNPDGYCHIDLSKFNRG